MNVEEKNYELCSIYFFPFVHWDSTTASGSYHAYSDGFETL